jgi:hypothetical protein
LHQVDDLFELNVKLRCQKLTQHKWKNSYFNLKLRRESLRFRNDEAEIFVGKWLRKKEPDFEYD